MVDEEDFARLLARAGDDTPELVVCGLELVTALLLGVLPALFSVILPSLLAPAEGPKLASLPSETAGDVRRRIVITHHGIVLLLWFFHFWLLDSLTDFAKRDGRGGLHRRGRMTPSVPVNKTTGST